MAANFGEYFAAFNSKVWTIVYAPIEIFTNYWAGLEYKQKLDESQLVPTSGVPKNHFMVPHAPLQFFDETNFPFNLQPEQKLEYTANSEADQYIDDFALFGIDIFKMIRTNHTLPDEGFVKKRYINKIRVAHPDKKTGVNSESILLNVARGRLSDTLYTDANEQINLFHAVLNTVLQDAAQEPLSLVQPATQNGSSPFLILFLAGSLAGCIAIFILKKPK